MFEIKVYGEIVSVQDPWVTEYGYYNLSALQRQLESAEGQPLLVRINSIGGDLAEGFAIYSELRRYATKNKVKIETLTEGQCASIATVVFLAGDKRVLNQYIEPFVHNAWVYEAGDAKTLRRTADVADRGTRKLAKFYADHTLLTEDEAIELMDNNTNITIDAALNMRFATHAEDIVKPAALLKYTNLKAKKMSKPEFTEEHDNLLTRLMNLVQPKTANKVVLKTAENEELTFPELKNANEIENGVEVLINGEKESGNYVMPSGETYEIENGKLKNTLKAEDQLSDLKNMVTSLKAKLQESQNSLTKEKEKHDETKTKLIEASNEIQNSIAVLNKLKGIEAENTPPNEGESAPAPPSTKVKAKYAESISKIV